MLLLVSGMCFVAMQALQLQLLLLYATCCIAIAVQATYAKEDVGAPAVAAAAPTHSVRQCECGSVHCHTSTGFVVVG
jgi:hypothetical protein